MNPKPEPSPDEIEALLDSGREDELIGVEESDYLDFKQCPHLLGTDKGKWELAKDVAALANSGGGALVIGVATEVPQDREEEIASKITPFPADMADVKRHRDAIDAASGVYPALRDVRIRRFERPGGKKLLLIVVPEQSVDDQPFMVVRMVEGDEKRGVGIGVPYRSGAHTYWLPPGQLHRDLADGRRSRSAPTSTEPPSTPPAPIEPMDEMTAERLEAIEQYMGWGEAPTYMLAAVPSRPQPRPIPGMYDPDRILGCVTEPPSIRHAGFVLAWRDTPRNESGALVNIVSDRSVLWVEPDGRVFAAAAGAPAFLTRSGGSGWPAGPGVRTVNPTVLVEWTYLFCLFIEQCMAPNVADDWRLAVRLPGARSRPWTLTLEPGRSRNLFPEGNPPGMDDWFAEFDWTGHADTAAFAVLGGVYSLFGHGTDAIPYTSEEAVDPDQIRAASG